MTSDALATQRLLLGIDGMSCAACVRRIEKGLQKLEGVAHVEVHLATECALIEYVPSLQSPAQLEAAIQKLGYDVAPVQKGLATAIAPAPPLRALFSLGVWLLAMILGMPLVAHDHTWLAQVAMPFGHFVQVALPWMWEWSYQTLHWILLGLHVPVLLWAGAPFFVRAVSALRQKTADMNTLVALGVSAAFGLSCAVTLWPDFFAQSAHPPAVYFESVSAVIGFVSFGKWLEERARRHSQNALATLAALIPATCRLVTPEGTRELATELLRVGDHIQVGLGERIPADARVVAGMSSLDTSHLTGEPLPIVVQVGSEVASGSTNGSGLLTLEVLRTGAESQVGRIAQLVQDAQNTRAPLQQTSDTLAAYFTPVVLGISVLTLLIWIIFGNPEQRMVGVLSAIAVLVVACPCAMGLAIPSALMVAIARAAKVGILVRDSASLQALGEVDIIWFDKTGTLTTGKPVVTQVRSFAPEVSETQLLGMAASVCASSHHPMSRAILQAAQERNLAWTNSVDSHSEAGLGILASVEHRTVRVGNWAWMKQSTPAPADTTIQSESLVYVSVDQQVWGAIFVQDTLRPEAARVVELLQEKGYAVGLLSGDTLPAVKAIATACGIQDFHASQTPASKQAMVQQGQAKGKRVLLVGDGVNDAPALQQANVGMAVAQGTDVAFACAGISLQREGIAGVLDALALGKVTKRTMLRNLFWAFGYNVLAIPVAAGVLVPVWGIALSPALAGAAMSMSSVSVLLSSLFLRVKRVNL